MILPMLGFAFMLMVVGGLASLVAAADGRHARLAVYVGPASLYAGLAALLLSVGLPVFCEQVLGLRALSGPGFFGGYGVGVVGGAAPGLRRAVKIQRRIESGARR
ncbi:MAG TPA: hypothetical protein VF591_13655 [Pyrinomonadaceae bacterium]|jgi:hypothetical protein